MPKSLQRKSVQDAVFGKWATRSVPEILRSTSPSASSMPPCSTPSRPSPAGACGSLDGTCARRLGDLRSGWRNACGAVEQRNGSQTPSYQWSGHRRTFLQTTSTEQSAPTPQEEASPISARSVPRLVCSRQELRPQLMAPDRPLPPHATDRLWSALPLVEGPHQQSVGRRRAQQPRRPASQTGTSRVIRLGFGSAR